MLIKKSSKLLSPEASHKLNAAELQLIQNISDKIEADDFRSPNTHVFALHNTLLRHYGPEWIHWLPETLWRQLTLDQFVLSSESIPREIKDKILSLQVALSTNRPWVEFEVFENVVTAFSGDVPHPFTLEPREPEECLLGMHCLTTIRANEEFAPEVLVYIASCFAKANLVHVGPARCLEKVQPFLDKFIFNHDLSKKTEKAFSSLWNNRTDYSIANIERLEDDPLKVQLRKLFGIYLYWESNYGIDARPS